MGINNLAVSEIFGPTFQGEGRSTGRRAAFLRLSGCNLQCAWCDTPYTWDWTGHNGVVYNIKDETHIMSYEQVLERIGSRIREGELLVITGGEPLLQHKSLAPLIQEAQETYDIEIETNGTMLPNDMLFAGVKFNVSPKLGNSLQPGTNRIVPEILRSFSILSQDGKAIFKFVCATKYDLEEVESLVEKFDIPNKSVWIMPEAKNVPSLDYGLRELAEAVLISGWNLTSRMHIAIWGDQRGK